MCVYYRDKSGEKRIDECMKHVKTFTESTYNSNVVADVGLFSGSLRIPGTGLVLECSVDGVGTKLKVAAAMNKFVTCGMDVVNHGLNDILCSGAKPIAFFDYIAGEQLRPDVIEQIMRGISIACRNEDVPLPGGETAEMSGFYNLGEYEIIGFAVGIVEEEKRIDGRNIKPDDVLIGLVSDGLHTNGYTLVRKIFFEPDEYKRGLAEYIPRLGTELYNELLKLHKCYVKPVHALLNAVKVNGIAHITGGGIPGNLARILPSGLSARVIKSKWQVPEIFNFIQEEGEVSEKKMFTTFNMGIGMILVVQPDYKDAALELLDDRLRCKAYEIGEITELSNPDKKIVIV